MGGGGWFTIHKGKHVGGDSQYTKGNMGGGGAGSQSTKGDEVTGTNGERVVLSFGLSRNE